VNYELQWEGPGWRAGSEISKLAVKIDAVQLWTNLRGGNFGTSHAGLRARVKRVATAGHEAKCDGRGGGKLEFHGSSFPRSILVSSSWTLENDTDTRTNEQHYTAADLRPISAWQAGRGSRRTRPTRTTCYGHPREDVRRMLRGKRSRGI